MYTRCPKCETCFRVTDRHLAIARGKVRCGKCQLVFNALENAIDDLPGKSPATSSPQATTPSPAKAEVKTEEMSPAAKIKAARIEAEKQNSAAVTPSAVEKKVVTNTTSAKQETAASPVKQAKVKQEKKSAVPPVPSPKVAPPLYKTNTSQADSKLTPISAKQDHHDAFHIEDDAFDDEFDLDAAIDELSHAAEKVTYDYDSTAIIEKPSNLKDEVAKEVTEKQVEEDKNDDVFSTDAYDATRASSVADIINDVEGQLSLDIDPPAQPADNNYNADNEFEFIELDEEPEKGKQDKEKDTEESNDEFIKNNFGLDEPGLNEPGHDNNDVFDLVDELDDFDNEEDLEHEPAHEKTAHEDSAEDFLDQFEALDVPGNKVKKANEEIIIADPTANEDPSLKIGEHSDDYEVPYQLREDVDRLNAASGRRLHPAFKVSLIVVLLLLSFSQLAYFRAHELVNIIPESRSILESFCESVGCQYSGPRDNKQIELVSRDVRLHPKEKNALLISAAMINNAYFAQPYPNIHIRLSDISGNVVAERIFNPKTYMGKLSNPFLLMRSKTPVHINFEVVDPGRDAVNFEFTFL